MQSETFISCVAWIHRGYAATVPLQYQANQEQIQQIKRDPMVEEHYKNQSEMEEEMEEEEDLPIFGDDLAGNHFKDKYPSVFEDMQDDEKEDYFIKDTDALIVAGKIEKQHSSLEVYVYEQQKNNLYVHHEIMLSSFPLSLAWLNVSLGSLNSNEHNKGNYAIVSSFLPEIEVWNLDLTEAIQPDIILGGQIATNKKKPKKFMNKVKKYKQGSHTDSVLTLSLNSVNKSILASGSADKCLKIWDLQKQANIFTSEHHKQKINKIQWSILDPSVIFTASDDGRLAVLDSRFPNDQIFHKVPSKFTVTSGCWNINQQSQIAYTTDQGGVYLIDVRVPDKVLGCHKQAHKDHEITDIKIGNKNMCFTCSEDQVVKVWSLSNLSQPLAVKNPHCVQMLIKQGKMFCMDLMECESGPVLSCGNGSGELFVWDVTENENIDVYWKS